MSKTISQEPIFIQNLEEFEKIRPTIYYTQYIKFNCTSCGMEVRRSARSISISKYPLLCKGCINKAWVQNLTPQERINLSIKRKKTSLKHFGVENPSQSELVKEKKKETSLKHYGVENPAQAQVVKDKLKQTWKGKSEEEKSNQKEKSKQTCLEKYGVEHPSQSENTRNKLKQAWKNKSEKDLQNWKEKREQTCLEKYGVTNPTCIANHNEKTKQTCLKKYGVEWPNQLESVRKKEKQTCLKKYGVEYPTQSQMIKEKSKQTCLKKYGVEYSAQSVIIKEKAKQTWISKNEKEKQIIKEKYKQTCLNRYGVKNIFLLTDVKKKAIEKMKHTWAQKSPEELKKIRSKACQKYTYQGQSFDSGWELAVWIWVNDCGPKPKYIQREPVSFKYVFEGKEHLYFPDFQIGDKLVEVKGPQFFAKDGKMQNPFNHTQDELFEAKHKCALQHGVEFWGEKEMKPILKYIENKYGKDYLNQYKK